MNTDKFIDDLVRIHRYFHNRPIIQAIWFIDRESQYHRLLVRTDEPIVRVRYVPVCSLYFMGIPIWNYWTMEIRQAIMDLFTDPMMTLEKARRVYPFCQQGVWLQMSNGQHQHIEIVSCKEVTEWAGG